MKIIHTADIHLDSPLTGVARPSERRMELVGALGDLAEYADRNGVSAIIIAGDLFDDKFATRQTVNGVADIVRRSRADWFILRGNHGGKAPYELLGNLCPQIRFFGEAWTPYSFGNVTICGRESGVNDAAYWRQLRLDPTRYNIVVLHGDADDPSYGLIDAKVLSESGARYVALGHRHSFCELRFGNVRGCYSGALEPRGFDEQAPTGFVEIDTDADRIKFVPHCMRAVVTKKLDVTGIDSDVALEREVYNAIRDVPPRNYLNFVFCGEIGDGLHLILVAKRALEGKFFALRVKDETRARIDVNAVSKEISLRGEFVKLAMTIENEELRNDVIKLGLAALNGEVLP